MLILSADDAFNIRTRQSFRLIFLIIFADQNALNLRKFESVLAFSSILTGIERSINGRERRVSRVSGWGRGLCMQTIDAPKRLSPVSGDVTGAARVGSS